MDEYKNITDIISGIGELRIGGGWHPPGEGLGPGGDAP